MAGKEIELAGKFISRDQRIESFLIYVSESDTGEWKALQRLVRRGGQINAGRNVSRQVENFPTPRRELKGASLRVV